MCHIKAGRIYGTDPVTDYFSTGIYDLKTIETNFFAEKRRKRGTGRIPLKQEKPV
jgi:hypothetical protein